MGVGGRGPLRTRGQTLSFHGGGVGEGPREGSGLSHPSLRLSVCVGQSSRVKGSGRLDSLGSLAPL